jgi:hypothetical protein
MFLGWSFWEVRTPWSGSEPNHLRGPFQLVSLHYESVMLHFYDISQYHNMFASLASRFLIHPFLFILQV